MARVKQGQGYRVSTTIRQRNLDGTFTLVDPGTIAGTLLFPDQTTTPFTPTKDAVGEYHADIAPATLSQLGPYQWKVVTTGVGAGVQDGSFDVVDPFATELVSIDDAKDYLRKSQLAVDDDDQLELMVAAVTEQVEGIVGPVGRRTVTETVYPSSGVLLLSTTPVLSITSITPYAGVALGVGTYTLLPSGVIIPATYGVGFYSVNYAVIYVAGRAAVPASVKEAALVILAHLWELQRGQGGGPRPGGFGEADVALTSGFGYAIPNRARDLLAPYRLAPAVA